METQKCFYTPDFIKVELPALRGTEKQQKFAFDIRNKYSNILVRKLSNLSPYQKQERIDLTNKFIAYVNHSSMINSYMWIENHCTRCGCYMNKIEDMSYCTNEYCNYQKANAFNTKINSGT